MDLFWWGVLAAVSVTTHALIGLLYYWLGLRHGAGLPRKIWSTHTDWRRDD